MARQCSIPGCEKPHTARSFCHQHYRAFLRCGGTRIAQPERHYGKTPEERFWLYVEKTPQCWEWTGYKNEKGYGVINLRGERMLAHRMAWQITVGPIPDEMFVLHHCDNPACVRSKHLFLGTRAENNADMDAKGRSRRVGGLPGTRNPSSKLTVLDVLAIRASPENGPTLAARYGVARQTIYAIQDRRLWTHVK